MSTDQTTTEQFRVDAFNHAFPIGTPVRYWTGEREGDGKNSATRTAAQILGGHTAVVWVGGEASCIALTHVEPIDQPDEIDEQTRELPNPARAAERVRDYICESGDGLYDVQGDKPLYARDLEAVTREVSKVSELRAEVERLRARLDRIATTATEAAAEFDGEGAEIPARLMRAVAEAAR